MITLLLSSFAIGVVSMALCPFEHEPLFKDVKTYRKPAEHSVCFTPDAKILENPPTLQGKIQKGYNTFSIKNK